MDKTLVAAILISLVLISVFSFIAAYALVTIVSDQAAPATSLEPLKLNDPLSLPIADYVEFDGLNRSDILALRRKAVASQPDLVPENYSPSGRVFSKIEDGRPWWGTLGLSYHGNGEKSIEGPSYHSFHVLNPYLLVGAGESWAFIVKDPKLEPRPIFQELVSLTWSGDQKTVHAVYNFTEYRRLRKDYHIPDFKRVDLYAYNARDFGYNYLYVDLERSTNVYSFGLPGAWTPLHPKQGDPGQIRQFIHKGRSCGFRGGCNNISPASPQISLKVYDLPSRAYIKLWKDQPISPDDEPDLVYVLDMI